MGEPFSNGCIFVEIYKPSSPCSIACMLKYQALPYQCYNDFRTHDRWILMSTNCDPHGIVRWQGPTTTYRPLFNPGGTASAGALRSTIGGTPGPGGLHVGLGVSGGGIGSKSLVTLTRWPS